MKSKEIAMQPTLWSNGRVYTPNGIIEEGCVLVDSKGKIVSIGDAGAAERWRTEPIHGQVPVERTMQGNSMLPGFIDVHVHGGEGYSLMEGTFADIEGMSLFHARHGTTSFLATTNSSSQERICRALAQASEAMRLGVSGAEVLGVHLEGPYLDLKRSGAQNKTHIRPPSVDEFELFYSTSKESIRLVTLAPELPGSEPLMDLLRAKGITISMGHSDATMEQAKEAVRRGASHTTHHFNGMSPFHHREPGLAGAGLMMEELTTELIADGIHVHPEVVKFLLETKGPDKVCFITDAVQCAGLPDGTYGHLMMRNGEVWLLDGSSLAGSSLTMIQALRNALQFTGWSLERLLPALTRTPARQIGVSDRKGSLTEGKDADFVLVDERLDVKLTCVNGVVVYNSR